LSIITVANKKGGVSKTLTACNVACLMAQPPFSEKVLIVDMDSQGDTTRSFGITPEDYKVCIYHLFMDQIRLTLKEKPNYKVTDAIIKTEYNVDLLPCDERISEVSTWLQDHADKFKRGLDIKNYWKTKFPYFLVNIFKALEGKYTRIIIDTPPAFEYNTKAALLASDYVIIPTELGDLELTGLENLYKKIYDLKAEYKNHISILGIVINRYEGSAKGARTVVERALEASLREHPMLGKYVFNTVIFRNTSVREAAVLGKLAVTYKKRKAKSVRQNFEDLVEEVEARLLAAATKING
jgi:chromosome partitioning protein